jgi:hypothetical protein
MPRAFAALQQSPKKSRPFRKGPTHLSGPRAFAAQARLDDAISHRVDARARHNIGKRRAIGSLDDVEDISSRGELRQPLAGAAREHHFDVVSATERPF